MQAVGIPSFVLDTNDGFLGRYFFVELVSTTLAVQHSYNRAGVPINCINTSFISCIILILYYYPLQTKTTEIKSVPQPTLGLELSEDDVAVRQNSCESGSTGSALQPEVPEALRPDLRLGPILGSGSYGRVYRAIYRNQRIAVKVWSKYSCFLPLLHRLVRGFIHANAAFLHIVSLSSPIIASACLRI